MIQRIKGMYDVLPPESLLWRRIEDVFSAVSQRYGFHRASTPIVEPTELFARSIGEATDIVEKEMYTFQDRNGKSLSLRPEGTASLVRAYVENQVYGVDPVAKWIYMGPMYRYEQPQKGRNRQFSQLGAEVFGVAAPEQDAEIMAMAWAFFCELGLEQDVRLELNTLGDLEERRRYRELLKAYLTDEKEALCADCRRRLDTNPLRVLDCKQEACSTVAQKAPSLLDHLGEETRTHFEHVRQTLEILGVPHHFNRRIVRGLDYYNRTTFEFKSSLLGAQDAVGGGGRYDALVAQFGGPETPAVGFAMGMERLCLLLEAKAKPAFSLDFFLIPMGSGTYQAALKLAADLRQRALCGEVDFSGRRLKNLFPRAERLGARYTLILGENELASGKVQVKDMLTKSQQELALDELCGILLKSQD